MHVEEIFSLSLGMQVFFFKYIARYVVLFVCNWSAWSICCSLCGVHVHGGKYSCRSGAVDDSHNYRLGCPTAERKRERVCVLVLIEELMETNSLALLDMRFNSKMHNTK